MNGYVRYYLPGQEREERWNIFKIIIASVCIALFMGVGLGYAWRMIQVEDDHKQEVKRLEKRIEYYQNSWKPIEQKIGVQKRSLKGKNGTGP